MTKPLDMAGADIGDPQPAGRFGWGAILFTALVSALVTLAAYTGFTR